jgi:hypothetical protein
VNWIGALLLQEIHEKHLIVFLHMCWSRCANLVHMTTVADLLAKLID